MLRAGERFAGRYAVEARAGSGGQGTVYRARDEARGEPVAIKVLDVVSGEGAAQRFTREAETLAGLADPGIVRYVGHGVAGGRAYLVMDWLEGEDLARRLPRAPLDVADSLALIRRVAGALAAAHRRGIVHRDLKPSNLFLRGGEVAGVTLIDFGLARALGPGHGLTATGMILGTPRYMAPEQATGAGPIDTSTDVFALGCVLFECLTGRHAFAGVNVEAVLTRILFEVPSRLHSLRPELPAELDALLAAMLARDPAARPADADALAALLDRLPAAAGPPPGAPVVRGHQPLADDEQRSVSVVVACRAAPISDVTQALPRGGGGGDGAAAEAQAALVRELGRLGAQVNVLVDGALAVLAAIDRATAIDQAMIAARGALLIRQARPELTVALATGHADGSRSSPLGEAFDRAWHMVDQVRRQERADHDVLIDGLTAGLLDARFRITTGKAGELNLLGEQRGIDEVRLLLGKPSPCLGRERELTTLEGLLRSCRDDQRAEAILITAASGVGKSRLRRELVQRLRERGEAVTVAIARGDPSSNGTPFGLAAQLVRRLCGAEDGDLPARVRLCIEGHVAGRIADPEPAATIADFLGELCQLDPGEPVRPALRAARRDPLLRADQISRAFAAFLEAECRHRPVLLVLDDLHWADAGTVRLLDGALRERDRRSLLVVALARPEVNDVFPDLWASRGCQRLRLGELGRRVCERLVEHALPAVDAAAVQAIVERSTGNALYLEELIRAHATGDAGGTPATVLAMIESRFMSLDPVPRRVLRLASLFGRRFGRRGLASLMETGPDDGELARALHQLVEREIIEPQPAIRPGDDEYAMRHALYHDAAYAMLPDADRRKGHHQVSLFYMETGIGQPLAEHLDQGGDREQAAVAYLEAAEQALASADPDGALAHARHGLDCRPSDPMVRGALRACQAQAYWWRFELSEADSCASEALGILPPGSARWYRVLTATWSTLSSLGRRDRFAGLTRQFLDATPAPDAGPAYQEAASLLAVFLAYAGQRDDAYRVMAQHEAVNREAAAGDPMAAGWLQFGAAMLSLVLEHDPHRTRRAAEAARSAFETCGDRRLTALQSVPLGVAEAELQGIDAGERVLRAGAAAAADVVSPAAPAVMSAEQMMIAVHLAQLLAQHGGREQLDEAQALARAVLEHPRPDPFLEGSALVALSHVHRRRGLAAEAEANARRAVERLQATPAVLPAAFAPLIGALLLRDGAVEAAGLAGEALAVVDAVGGTGACEVPLRLAAAEAYQAAGDADRAGAARDEARRIAERRAAGRRA